MANKADVRIVDLYLRLARKVSPKSARRVCRLISSARKHATKERRNWRPQLSKQAPADGDSNGR